MISVEHLEPGGGVKDILTKNVQYFLEILLSHSEWLQKDEAALNGIGVRLRSLERHPAAHGMLAPHTELQDVIEAHRSSRRLTLEAAGRVKKLIGLLEKELPPILCEAIADRLQMEIVAMPAFLHLEEVVGWRTVETWITDLDDRIKFQRPWDFFAELLLGAQEVDDFLELQERLFAKDIDRYGPGRRAKLLYGWRALRSVWPQFKWALHRLAALEVFRRFFH